MPATLQPVIVTPSLPLLLAFYKRCSARWRSPACRRTASLLVGLQLGNAELAWGRRDADVTAPQRILLNVNVTDLGGRGRGEPPGNVEVLGGRAPRPAERRALGRRPPTSSIRQKHGTTSPSPSPYQVSRCCCSYARQPLCTPCHFLSTCSPTVSARPPTDGVCAPAPDRRGAGTPHPERDGGGGTHPEPR